MRSVRQYVAHDDERLPFKVGEQTGGFGIVMRAAWLERRRKS